MSDNLRDILDKAFSAARPTSRSPAPTEGSKGSKSTRIVSSEDERGTRYPGDFPNPSDTNYGCF